VLHNYYLLQYALFKRCKDQPAIPRFLSSRRTDPIVYINFADTEIGSYTELWTISTERFIVKVYLFACITSVPMLKA